MIRPLTCICFLLACGSGLYLYQSKHRVQVLDRQIEDTVHATDALREQTRVLHAEWTLLNDPQRLQTLANQFLSLKTVAPGQFASTAELDSRLPPVGAPDAAPPAAQSVPIAQEQEPAPVDQPAPSPPDVATPPALKPAALIAAAPPPHASERKAARSQPALAEAPRPRVVPLMPHPIVAAEVARPELPAPAPPGGSALGMARNASIALPRPMPINASPWPTSGGGG